jgi:hypothetical protein
VARSVLAPDACPTYETRIPSMTRPSCAGRADVRCFAGPCPDGPDASPHRSSTQINESVTLAIHELHCITFVLVALQCLCPVGLLAPKSGSSIAEEAGILGRPIRLPVKDPNTAADHLTWIAWLNATGAVLSARLPFLAWMLKCRSARPSSAVNTLYCRSVALWVRSTSPTSASVSPSRACRFRRFDLLHISSSG